MGQSPAVTGGRMSRLDRHVALVQNKLTLGKLLTALAW
jgi:hypothetical protein